MMKHTGPARVFEQEEPAVAAIYNGEIKPGDVVVVRYEGPKGGPGMREMLTATSAIIGLGLGASVALRKKGKSGLSFWAQFAGVVGLGITILFFVLFCDNLFGSLN